MPKFGARLRAPLACNFVVLWTVAELFELAALLPDVRHAEDEVAELSGRYDAARNAALTGKGTSSRCNPDNASWAPPFPSALTRPAGCEALGAPMYQDTDKPLPVGTGSGKSGAGVHLRVAVNETGHDEPES